MAVSIFWLILTGISYPKTDRHSPMPIAGKSDRPGNQRILAISPVESYID